MTIGAAFRLLVVMVLWAACFPLITIGLDLAPHLAFAALRGLERYLGDAADLHQEHANHLTTLGHFEVGQLLREFPSLVGERFGFCVPGVEVGALSVEFHLCFAQVMFE